jgi:CRISPR-associated protein Cas1
MSWRIVYIENADTMQLYLDNLLVKRGDEKAIIPLSDIFSIIVDKLDVTITGKLINKLAEYRIGIAFCDERHLPCNYLLGLNSYFKVSQNINKQLQWSSQGKALLWQKIVKQKIHNQKELLKHLNLEDTAVNYLDGFEHEVEVNDSTNREGLSAKVYFRALFGADFVRNEDGFDGYNSALNYGYSILRSCVARTIVANGLHPSVGIWHCGCFNAFNLADDCMEIFRPVIDMWTVLNFDCDIILDKNHKIELIDCMNKKLSVNGEKRTVISVIGIYISSIIKVMSSGNTDELLTLDNAVYL